MCADTHNDKADALNQAVVLHSSESVHHKACCTLTVFAAPPRASFALFEACGNSCSSPAARGSSGDVRCMSTLWKRKEESLFSLAGDDRLDGSGLGHAAGLALQLAIKVLDGVLVLLHRLQVGHHVGQTPHFRPLLAHQIPQASAAPLSHAHACTLDEHACGLTVMQEPSNACH